MNLKSLFSRKEKFTDYVPKTPTERAEKRWDERVGEPVVRMHNLRRIIIGLLVSNLVVVGGIVYQSQKSTAIVHVVEVDTSTGMVKNVGPIHEAVYTPQKAEIQYFLTKFIANTRAIPLDPVVYTQQWTDAANYMTKQCFAKMDAEYKSSGRAQMVGNKTVQINIISILPLEGGNSYQVRWEENEFSIGNGDKKTVPMSGIFTVSVIPPKEEKLIRVNPLGIYFNDFNWSKDAASTDKVKQK